MTETEQRLRCAMNSLILMVAFSVQQKKAIRDFEALLSVSDYEKKMFEQPRGMAAFADAKECLFSSGEKVRDTFGKAAIADAYEAFKEALTEETFLVETGLSSPLSASEGAVLFNAVFQKIKEQADDLPDEADGYAVLLNLIREIRTPAAEEVPKQDVCPYCGGIPDRVSRTEFFGKNTDDCDGYVLACECGAYAYIGKDGKVEGTLADRELHRKRKAVRKLVFELGSLTGTTVYEGCKWISWVCGAALNGLRDVEFLNIENCEKVLNEFESVKVRIRQLRPQFPASHGEMMRFLDDGGRIMVKNAFGYQYGRVFVPIKVGTDAIRVRFHKTVQEIMLPKNLNYGFEGDGMTVTHPSGKREKYKLFAKEQREELYRRSENNE